MRLTPGRGTRRYRGLLFVEFRVAVPGASSAAAAGGRPRSAHLADLEASSSARGEAGQLVRTRSKLAILSAATQRVLDRTPVLGRCGFSSRMMIALGWRIVHRSSCIWRDEGLR